MKAPTGSVGAFCVLAALSMATGGSNRHLWYPHPSPGPERPVSSVRRRVLVLPVNVDQIRDKRPTSLPL